MAEPLGAWENGLRLLSYQVGGQLCPGGAVKLTTYWAVSQTASAEYHFFNHLVAQDRTLVSQQDGPGVTSLEWMAGNRLVTWFSLPLPADLVPGSYDLYCGLYGWPSLERVPVAGGGPDRRLHLTSLTVTSCGQEQTQ